MAIDIGRREFIAALGSATVWPFAARAQQAERIRRIGFLATGLESNPLSKDYANAFLHGLDALSWKDGVNLHIDWRWGGVDARLMAHQAAELVALAPDVLLAGGNLAVEPLREQTRTIPVVFALVSDPIGMGYVQSLAHPGGNITGFSSYDPPIYTKQVQMLTQITPQAETVAALYNPESAPYAGRMVRAMDDAAKALGVVLRDAPCHDDGEIEAMMSALAQDGRGGLLALGDAFNQVHIQAIISLALKYRIPTVVATRQFTESGALMSYTINIPDLFRRSANYVDRILKGAKPSDLPVQQPTEFEMAINLKTAKALGVTIAPSLLAIADEVIE